MFEHALDYRELQLCGNHPLDVGCRALAQLIAMSADPIVAGMAVAAAQSRPGTANTEGMLKKELMCAKI